MYDASLVRAGVELSTSILARYGRPAPTVLSQRDVPGLTQALVPVLSGLGVKAVSVGCNNAAQPPDVPPIFRWQGAGRHATESILALVHPGGYAELEDDPTPGCDGGADCRRNPREYYTVEGLDEALVMAWNSDNLGPPTLEDVLQTL